MRSLLVLLIFGYALTCALGNRHHYTSSKHQHSTGDSNASHDFQAAKNEHNEKREPWVIRGLGDFNHADVRLAKSIIESHLKAGAVISTAQEPLANCYQSGGDLLEASKCLDNMCRSGERTIYVTNQKIQDGKTALRGFTRMHGRVVVVKSNAHFKHTLMHEIGHTYGLAHCPDKRCLMAIHNDEQETGKFCSKCIKLLPQDQFIHLKSLSMSRDEEKKK